MRRATLALFAALALRAVGTARADVASPERTACSGKARGDACWHPVGGTCATDPHPRRPEEADWLHCEAAVPDGPVTARLIVGVFAGLAVAAGGVWLAIRKRPA